MRILCLFALLLGGIAAQGAGSTTKFQPINVGDWGAKGDGITDDTAAFTNALAQARSEGKQTIVPPGHFKITAPLYMTNQSLMGALSHSVFYPSNFSGAALILITTNSSSAEYSEPAAIESLVVDGRDNPSGCGICIGTNYMGAGGGNYTAQIQLHRVVCRAFTNGVGLWIGNTLGSEIGFSHFDSNYCGIRFDAPGVGITTTRVHDSKIRNNLWSGVYAPSGLATWFGPNNILERNFQHVFIFQPGTYNFLVMEDNWFESNWYWSILNAVADPPTNHFSFEVIGTNLTKVSFKGNHFNTGDLQPRVLCATNVAQMFWDDNSIASVIGRDIELHQTTNFSSFFHVQGFQQYQKLADFIYAPDGVSVTPGRLQDAPDQWENYTNSTYWHRIKNFSVQNTGENQWTNALVTVTTNGVGSKTVVNMPGGHTYWNHYAAQGVQGQVGIYDETAAKYDWYVDTLGELWTILGFGATGTTNGNAQIIRIGPGQWQVLYDMDVAGDLSVSSNAVFSGDVTIGGVTHSSWPASSLSYGYINNFNSGTNTYYIITGSPAVVDFGGTNVQTVPLTAGKWAVDLNTTYYQTDTNTVATCYLYNSEDATVYSTATAGIQDTMVGNSTFPLTLNNVVSVTSSSVVSFRVSTSSGTTGGQFYKSGTNLRWIKLQ